MLMCCYFNIGIEAAVGYSFETMRTRTKCCNKFIYAMQSVKVAIMNMRAQTIKDRIMAVVSRPN